MSVAVLQTRTSSWLMFCAVIILAAVSSWYWSVLPASVSWTVITSASRKFLERVSFSPQKMLLIHLLINHVTRKIGITNFSPILNFTCMRVSPIQKYIQFFNCSQLLIGCTFYSWTVAEAYRVQPSEFHKVFLEQVSLHVGMKNRTNRGYRQPGQPRHYGKIVVLLVYNVTKSVCSDVQTTSYDSLDGLRISIPDFVCWILSSTAFERRIMVIFFIFRRNLVFVRLLLKQNSIIVHRHRWWLAYLCTILSHELASVTTTFCQYLLISLFRCGGCAHWLVISMRNYKFSLQFLRNVFVFCHYYFVTTVLHLAKYLSRFRPHHYFNLTDTNCP